MGIIQQSYDLFFKWVTSKTTTICELGDQQVFYVSGIQEGAYAKDTIFKGMSHTSLDKNGKGGSISVDLNKDIDVSELPNPQFGVVTNYGTLEHIDNLYMGFKNMHKLCIVGGKIFHVFPSPLHWVGHGNWRVSIDFFKKLALLQNYKVLDLYEEKTSYGGTDSNQIYVVFFKAEETGFINEEIFYSLGVYRVKPFGGGDDQ